MQAGCCRQVAAVGAGRWLPTLIAGAKTPAALAAGPSLFRRRRCAAPRGQRWVRRRRSSAEAHRRAHLASASCSCCCHPARLQRPPAQRGCAAQVARAVTTAAARQRQLWRRSLEGRRRPPAGQNSYRCHVRRIVGAAGAGKARCEQASSGFSISCDRVGRDNCDNDKRLQSSDQGPGGSLSTQPSTQHEMFAESLCQSPSTCLTIVCTSVAYTPRLASSNIGRLRLARLPLALPGPLPLPTLAATQP